MSAWDLDKNGQVIGLACWFPDTLPNNGNHMTKTNPFEETQGRIRIWVLGAQDSHDRRSVGTRHAFFSITFLSI